MSIGLIGTKLGMTREFIQSGQSVPVTVIKIEKGMIYHSLNYLLLYELFMRTESSIY